MESLNRLCEICCLPEGIVIQNDIFTNLDDSAVREELVIELNSKNHCQICDYYNKNFNKDFLREELDSFIDKSSSNSVLNAAVAFSGGKNSAYALYLSKIKLGLNVKAFLLDNGFIPDAVKSRAKWFCDKLNVDLVIIKDTIVDDFNSIYSYDKKNDKWTFDKPIDLCYHCNFKINFNLGKFILDSNINKVIFGVNTYLDLSPKISSIKKTFNYFDHETYYQVLALPYSLQVSEKEERDDLLMLGWYDIDIKGYSSNCLIPGFLNSICKSKVKVPFDLAYLSKELRSGYLSKESYWKILNEKNEISNQNIIDYIGIDNI
jgi:predicted PP-loop superfamily ATPase